MNYKVLYICIVQFKVKHNKHNCNYQLVTKMYNAAKNSRLMSGLVDKCVEFFYHKNEVYCLHDGVRYTFEETPKWIIEKIEEDMLQYPDAMKALASWENLDESEWVRQYIICRFGGIDDEPDIDLEGNVHHAEYFDCGLRGQCRYEGKLCTALKVENGYLGKAEIEVLRYISLPDKLIADKLNKSIDTIITQQQTIRAKTGMRSKVELAIFAQKKGIAS